MFGVLNLSKSKQNKYNIKKIDNQKKMIEALKMEIAKELGLADKVLKYGWGGLSSAESGRIGGILARRLKAD